MNFQTNPAIKRLHNYEFFVNGLTGYMGLLLIYSEGLDFETLGETDICFLEDLKSVLYKLTFDGGLMTDVSDSKAMGTAFMTGPESYALAFNNYCTEPTKVINDQQDVSGNLLQVPFDLVWPASGCFGWDSYTIHREIIENVESEKVCAKECYLRNW
eukprot:UN31060